MLPILKLSVMTKTSAHGIAITFKVLFIGDHSGQLHGRDPFQRSNITSAQSLATMQPLNHRCKVDAIDLGNEDETPQLTSHVTPPPWEIR